VSTIAFVHGAWHGVWCWQRLLPELTALGHQSVVMDLPVDDGNATFDDYATVVSAACPDAVNLVLIGHSLGAMVLPLVAARRRVSLMIFLCGLIPNVKGMPWYDAPPMGRPEAYQTVTRDDGSAVFPTPRVGSSQLLQRLRAGRCCVGLCAAAAAELTQPVGPPVSARAASRCAARGDCGHRRRRHDDRVQPGRHPAAVGR
jgi:pimeloyl-ACP methyl ester carboxylesterase